MLPCFVLVSSFVLSGFTMSYFGKTSISMPVCLYEAILNGLQAHPGYDSLL